MRARIIVRMVLAILLTWEEGIVPVLARDSVQIDDRHPSLNERMHQAGVRRALVRTQFEWHGKPVDVRVDRIAYFSKNDDNCAQISEPDHPSSIRTSRLENRLAEAAIRRTAKAYWLLIDRRHPIRRGVGIIRFVDDPAIRIRIADFLAPVPKVSSSLGDAVDMDDVAEAARILRAGHKPSRT